MHDLGPNSLEQSPMLNEIFGNHQETGYPQQAEAHNLETYETNPHEYQEYSTHETAYRAQDAEADELQQYEYEMGYESHANHEHGYSNEMAAYGSETGSLSHEEEIALAAELLNVRNDQELQQFLGKLIRGAGRLIRTPVGRTLTNALRQVASRALPIVAKVAGTTFGGPLGGAAAGMLAQSAGKALGLEVSGMTQDEANFAAARQFVRFAENAASRAAKTDANSPGAVPTAVAQAAMTQAAQQFAPGLLGPQHGTIPAPRMQPRRATRGVWVRRGTSIVIYGV